MIAQQAGVTGGVGGGKGSQMISSAGNQAGGGEETQGRRVERTTNRNRGKIKKKTEIRQIQPKKKTRNRS